MDTLSIASLRVMFVSLRDYINWLVENRVQDQIILDDEDAQAELMAGMVYELQKHVDNLVKLCEVL